jgi:uncharacterized protein YbjT (DUF2867 family)
MIVVTTPTGQIGSEVVRHLLTAGEEVRVIARDPAKLAPEVRSQVDVVSGSHADFEVLSAALTGAESLFWVVPPSLRPPDPAAYYVDYARTACRALVERGVRRVVAVSAVGRRVSVDAGVVSAAHASDAEFERAGVDYRALWCPSFMDNMLTQLSALKEQGTFFLPERPDLKTPKVATRDIGASGARLLLNRDWTGPGGLAALGPEDLSNDDMAAILSDVLETPIRFQQISGEAYEAQLMGYGGSEGFAHGLVVMHEAKSNGLDNSEPRNAENTTPTTFRQWCEEVLKPAFAA